EAGAKLIFVPSCTEDRAGFLRVRRCCQARAIENQIYVVMTSTVGALPVSDLHTHYGQAGIFTPSENGLPEDGIAAEGKLCEPDIIAAALDLAMLDHARANGTVKPLRALPVDTCHPVACVEDADMELTCPAPRGS